MTTYRIPSSNQTGLTSGLPRFYSAATHTFGELPYFPPDRWENKDLKVHRVPDWDYVTAKTEAAQLWLMLNLPEGSEDVLHAP